MALYMMLVMGGTPLGAPIVGWVGATFGARWTLIGGGAMSVIGVCVAVLAFGGVTFAQLRLPGHRADTEATTDEAMAA